MDQLDQEFNQAFAHKGGIWDLSELDENTYFKKLLKTCRNSISKFQNPTRNLPEYHMGIINNPEFNAVAKKYNGKYFIGIYVGTIMILDNLFKRMLSNPNILTSYGVASSETNTNKIFNAQITDYENLFNIVGDSDEPIDVTRNN